MSETCGLGTNTPECHAINRDRDTHDCLFHSLSLKDLCNYDQDETMAPTDTLSKVREDSLVQLLLVQVLTLLIGLVVLLKDGLVLLVKRLVTRKPKRNSQPPEELPTNMTSNVCTVKSECLDVNENYGNDLSKK
nr:hypothetical protein [Cressdnaviricota sp.]UOF78935.1 hypothetical protein [Cressdnaviricota sp.]